METEELKNIWKALASNNLIDKELAKENIEQIITKKGRGILNKLLVRLRKDIRLDIVNAALTAIVIVGAQVFQHTKNIGTKPHVIILVILGYFLFKLSRDLRKYKMLKITKLTESIRDTTLLSYQNFKKRIKQDTYINIIFLLIINLWLVLIYFKTFGHISTLDFTSVNGQLIGFVLMIVLMLHAIAAPWIFKFIYRKRYNVVINDFETTIRELSNY